MMIQRRKFSSPAGHMLTGVGEMVLLLCRVRIGRNPETN